MIRYVNRRLLCCLSGCFVLVDDVVVGMVRAVSEPVFLLRRYGCSHDAFRKQDEHARVSTSMNMLPLL